jgi:hypothetical protein
MILKQNYSRNLSSRIFMTNTRRQAIVGGRGGARMKNIATCYSMHITHGRNGNCIQSFGWNT